jgi:YD repeat-containing protein
MKASYYRKRIGLSRFDSYKLVVLACLIGLLSYGSAIAGTTNYYYDATGRLTGAFRTTGDNQWYKYDGADNRAYMSSAGLNLPYQAAGLQPNTTLFQNQSITSADGRFVLALQYDGNLVLYQVQGFQPLWWSGTYGSQAAILLNIGNGNVAIFDPQFNILWQTNTNGYPNANLVLQNDGNLVLYSGSTAIWNSGTCCH